jgi:hypothetical protein
MAQNRSLPDLLRAIVSGIAQCENVVLARIWLVAPGDICDSCRFRPECPDQARCLHLAASAGNPGDRMQNYARLDGAFRRFPLGVRKIGRVGQSGEPLLLADVRGDEEWIAEPRWMKREGREDVRRPAAHLSWRSAWRARDIRHEGPRSGGFQLATRLRRPRRREHCQCPGVRGDRIPQGAPRRREPLPPPGGHRGRRRDWHRGRQSGPQEGAAANPARRAHRRRRPRSPARAAPARNSLPAPSTRAARGRTARSSR